MQYKHSPNVDPKVGQNIIVKRPGVSELISYIRSTNDIAFTFSAEITTISSEGFIETVKITKSPEYIKFENKSEEHKFNNQFKVGELIDMTKPEFKFCEITFL